MIVISKISDAFTTVVLFPVVYELATSLNLHKSSYIKPIKSHTLNLPNTDLIDRPAEVINASQMRNPIWHPTLTNVPIIVLARSEDVVCILEFQ